MIEIEVQNETHQSQTRMRFAAVPRIGEGMRLREPDGMWASYDVLDVWYQKAEFGDVWLPYLHVKITPGDAPDDASENVTQASDAADGVVGDVPDYDDVGAEDHIDESVFASLAGEAEPFKI